MSLMAKPIQEGKCCFAYCGDDRCDCGAGRIRSDSLEKTPEQWMRFALEIIADGRAPDPRGMAKQCLEHIAKI
jgi:hypothetical protein